MDSEEREAMIEDGYDPDGAPPPPELWLMPPDNDGERMWAQTRVTPWDVRYVPEAALATERARYAETARDYEELRKLIDGGSESMTHTDAVEEVRGMEAALATERAARERVERERDALTTMLVCDPFDSSVGKRPVEPEGGE
jgi:hypothetical protein